MGNTDWPPFGWNRFNPPCPGAQRRYGQTIALPKLWKVYAPTELVTPTGTDLDPQAVQNFGGETLLFHMGDFSQFEDTDIGAHWFSVERFVVQDLIIDTVTTYAWFLLTKNDEWILRIGADFYPDLIPLTTLHQAVWVEFAPYRGYFDPLGPTLWTYARTRSDPVMDAPPDHSYAKSDMTITTRPYWP